MTATAVQRARFRERVRFDGSRLDADVTGRLLSATMTRAYDSATSVELMLDDQDFLILRSGLISRRGKVRQHDFDQASWARVGETRMVLDGIPFRLAGLSGVYNASQRQLTVTFEDELAALMRRKKAKKAKRFTRGDWHKGHDTRSTVLWNLIVEALGDGSRFMTPELFDKQPVKGDSDKAQAKARKKGLAGKSKLTIAGAKATGQQLANLETILTVADSERAGELATLAMLVGAIGESRVTAIPNAAGSGYAGVFQADPANVAQNDTKGQAHYFLVGGKGFQGGGAIKLAADHPDYEPGQIALLVEGSRSNFPSETAAIAFYQQWATEAQSILAAWGGGAGVGPVRLIKDPFFFTVEKGENYFDAAGRLAKEVRWRFWVDQNQIWYVPDEFLFKSATTLTIAPDTPGVFGISFNADVGIPIGELQVDANIARWVGSPGWRTEIDGMGPLNGLWLLAQHEQDLFTEDSTITLRRPAPELKEPAAPTEKVVQTETRPEAGSTRDALMRACKRAYGLRQYYSYSHLRPYPASLFPKVHGAPKTAAPIPDRVYVDCSSFATLVYKAAGAPDPNSRGYDGQGFTGSLWANGERTNDPQPGDLCFYGNPGDTSSHVNVYAGNGKAYNMGPSAGLSLLPVKSVRNDFTGYRTYPLEG